MTTADQLAIVESFLGDADLRAVVLAEGGLVQGWMKSKRLLVVVQRKPECGHAVFVFQSSVFPVSCVKDLLVDAVVPVDEDFRYIICAQIRIHFHRASSFSSRCEIDSGDAVLVNLLHKSVKLMFEMLPGYHTQNFVSELFRLQDSGSAKDFVPDFSWIKKYEAKTIPGKVYPSKVVAVT
jgi:hypothetical protein